MGDDEIRSMLQRIEENQRTALELQREQLEMARSQVEFSTSSIKESVQLQRTAIARQAKLTIVLFPIIAALLLLLVYLLFRWNII